MNNEKFIKITPLVIINNTIIFVFTKDKEQYIQDESFKGIKNLVKDMFYASEEYFYFSSEFGLLSDQHFMNNFVRGYREYSHYTKSGNGYCHGINEQLIKYLKMLFPVPKL